MNSLDDNFFYFKDKYPECNNNILQELGLIKFRKEMYSQEQIDENTRFFNESLCKAKDEIKFIEETYHIDKVKHWKNDERYRKFILSHRKENADEERVPTFVNGTLNKDLTDEQYVDYFITMQLATNLKRVEQLKEHIDYFTTALHVLNNDFKMATL